MPLPPIPEFASITVADNCANRPVQFSLDDVTAAIEEATPDQINAFVTALQEKCDIVRLTVPNMTVAASVATESEIGDLDSQLRVVSPLTATLLAETVSALSLPEVAPLMCALGSQMDAAQLGPTTQIIIEEAGAAAVGEWIYDKAQCLWKNTLHIPGGGAVEAIPDILEFKRCNGEIFKLVTPVLQARGDIEGFPPNTEFSQTEFFQTVLHSLEALMNCCNPCHETDWISLSELEGDAAVVVPSTTIVVKFVEVTNTNPVVFWFGGDPLTLYGKFHWGYEDGTKGPVAFLNSDGQCIDAPEDHAVTSFWVKLHPGVKLHAYYKSIDTREIAVEDWLINIPGNLNP